MAQTQIKQGETWYIYDDATGACTKVQINDITESTVELVYLDTPQNGFPMFYKTTADGKVIARFVLDYVNFVEKVIERTMH